MTATMTALADVELVESYVRLDGKWRDEGRPHRWSSCRCIVCADVRRHMGYRTIQMTVAHRRFEALAPLPSFDPSGGQP